MLSEDSIRLAGISVSCATRLIVSAKISDLHIVFLNFIFIFALPHKIFDYILRIAIKKGSVTVEETEILDIESKTFEL